MPTCDAYGCSNRTCYKTPGISFHRFPKSHEQREAWVKACRRKNWMPSKFSALCSEHFTEDQIDRTSLSSVRLRENAVPNIFSAFPSYLQKAKKCRKPPINRDALVTSAGSNKQITQLNKQGCDKKTLDELSTDFVSDSEGILETGKTHPFPGSVTTYDASTSTSPFKKTADDETLKRKVEECEVKMRENRKKIRLLQQVKRRYRNKIQLLNSLFEDLKQKN